MQKRLATLNVLKSEKGTRVRVEVGVRSVIVGAILKPLRLAGFSFEIAPDGADHGVKLMEPDVRSAVLLVEN